MVAINNCADIVLQNLHDVAGKKFFPLAIHHTLVRNSGQTLVPQQLFGLINLIWLLTLGPDLLQKGLGCNQIPSLRVGLCLFFQHLFMKVGCMVVGVWS